MDEFDRMTPAQREVYRLRLEEMADNVSRAMAHLDWQMQINRAGQTTTEYVRDGARGVVGLLRGAESDDAILVGQVRADIVTVRQRLHAALVSLDEIVRLLDAEPPAPDRRYFES